MNRILSYFVLVFFFIVSASTSAKSEHLDSIKVYLPFYGNMNDWSGWNNNGQSSNGVLGTDRYGNVSCAFLIQDSSGFFRVPSKNVHVPTFTHSQWVQLNERPDSNGMTIFEMGTDSCLQSLKLFPLGPDSIWMEYRLPFNTADSVKGMAVRMPTQSWHHLTTMRSRDSVYFYFDVLFSTEFYVPGNVCHTGDWVYYGASHDSSSALDGTLDEVRIFSENIEPSLLLTIVSGERLSLEKAENRDWSVYPNPGSGKIGIESKKIVRGIVLRNMLGVSVFSMDGVNSEMLEFPLVLPAGVYLLELEFQDGSRSSKRIVRE